MSAAVLLRRISTARPLFRSGRKLRGFKVVAHSVIHRGAAAAVGASFATLASTLQAPIALALQYELPEAPSINYPPVAAAAAAVSDGSVPSLSMPDFTLPDITIPADLQQMVIDNPVAFAGAGVGIFAAIVLSSFLGAGSNTKAQSTTAKEAYDILSTNELATLLDVRSKTDVTELGTPDLRALKKKAVTLPFTKTTKGKEGSTTAVVEDFAERALKLKELTAESIVVLIDTDGKLSSKAGAALLASELTVQKVYYVKGGVDAWKAAELPWKKPSKGFALPDLSALAGSLSLDQVAENYKKNPTVGNLGIAALALGGAVVFAIQELEIVLEAVGVYAAGVLLAKNLLFAEDRDRTFGQLKELFQSKIAVGDMGSDMKKLADTILSSESAEVAAAKLQAAAPVEAKAAAAPPAAPDVTPAGTAPAPAAPVAAVEVPAHVSEARAWINNWRRQQLEASMPAAKTAVDAKVLTIVNY